MRSTLRNLTRFALAFVTVTSVCLLTTFHCEQIDYQPQIDNHQNLFACSYLAKYSLDRFVNETFPTEDDFPNKDRLKLFYKMITHCRGQISLQTSAQLIQSGFDYDEKFDSTMLDTVRQLTNYGGFIRNKGALSLSEADKETIEVMFEISKNEGERHGKMPSFGRTGKPINHEKVKAKIMEEQAEKAPTESEMVDNVMKQEEEVVTEKQTPTQEKSSEATSKQQATPVQKHEAVTPVKEQKTIPSVAAPVLEDNSFLNQLLDLKTIIILVGIVIFVLYQRQQSQQMQVMLKLKELEVQAALAKNGSSGKIASTTGSAPDSSSKVKESKKKK